MSRDPRIFVPGFARDRRRFLRDASRAALAGALVGCDKDGEAAAQVQAGLWGAPRAGGEGALLPTTALSQGTLEVFLIGGLSMWETFYTVPDYGQAERRMWHTFLEGGNGVEATWRQMCGGGDAPLLLDPWANDALGMGVRLGPFIDPLRQRPDILSRMRMWVLRHPQGAHETAVPYVLCGHPMSSPQMASTAAHVERYLQDRQPAGRATPWSTVIYPDLPDLVQFNGEAASAIGQHRGSSRPLSLRLSLNGIIRDGLDRAQVQSKKDAIDRAIRGYAYGFEQRLWRRDTDARVRAPAMDDWSSSRAMLERSESLIDVIGDASFGGRQGTECSFQSGADNTQMGMGTAVRMLLHELGPKWVTMIDGGLLPATAGAAYDVHIRHVQDTARNIHHTMRELVARINEPGEGDPGKLDLDRHQVLITTEFGRTPYAVNDGSNHWSEGYVVVGFGGPQDAERRGILGALSPTGEADSYITPTDFRAAMMLTHGIWPFSGQSFNVADVSADVLDETEATWWLREHVLGYRS